MNKNKKIILLLIFLIIVLVVFLYYNTKIEKFQNNMNTTYELPKQIWIYWDSNIMPKNVKLITDNIIKNAAAWKVTILSDTTIDKYIRNDKFPKKYSTLSPQHKADFIRLYLLKNYGGLWLDASIIVNDYNALNNLYNESIEKKSQLTVFNKEYEWQTDSRYPIIENWFIMAPKDSYIISIWLQEYEKAIEMSFENYRKDLESNGINLQEIIGTYHIQHLAMQKILQKDITNISDILIKRADDNMLKFAVDCNIDDACMKDKIKDKKYMKQFPYIKLNGCLRDLLDGDDYFS